MTPDQIQSQLNLLQAELDKLKQLPDGMIGNSSDSPYVEHNNHYIPQPGEVVLIYDDGDDFEPRIFLKYNKGTNEPFECVAKSHEGEYRNGESYETITWKFCRRISGEIIEFGCDKYTHLLPTGYEFCAEGEHTGWVKIRLIGDEGENKLGYSFYGLDCANKPYYRPIRPIQFHVAVHEVVTVADEPIKVAEYYQPLFNLLHKEHNLITTQSELDEIIRTAWSLGKAEHECKYCGAMTSQPDDQCYKNPYAVDWANAPAYADFHTFEFDDYGWWRGSYLTNDGWIDMAEQSGFTLPTGLDWKLSKTVRPR